MNVKEFRSRLDSRSAAQGLGGFPSSAPDWVVQRMYEQSEGLPLSPLPVGTRVFKTGAEFRSFVAQTKPAPAAATESKAAADAEMERLRLRYLNISL